MEKNLFAICRKAPIENESGDILSDKTALYTLCLENLVLTSVPTTLFIFLAISRMCPIIAQFPNSKYGILTKKSKLIIILCTSLSIYQILQIFSLWTKNLASAISCYYGITEFLAWILSSGLVFVEDLKNLPRS